MDYIILETQDQCHYFVEELEDSNGTCDLNLPNHTKSIIMTKWWIPTSIGRKNHKEKKNQGIWTKKTRVTKEQRKKSTKKGNWKSNKAKSNKAWKSLLESCQ